MPAATYRIPDLSRCNPFGEQTSLHAAEDRGAAVTDGIRRAEGNEFDDDAWGDRKSVCGAVKKKHRRALPGHQMRNRPLPGGSGPSEAIWSISKARSVKGKIPAISLVQPPDILGTGQLARPGHQSDLLAGEIRFRKWRSSRPWAGQESHCRKQVARCERRMIRPFSPSS